MSPKSIKVTLVIISVLPGVIAALVTGILVRSGRGSIPTATLSGGGAFVTIVPLVLTIMKFLVL